MNEREPSLRLASLLRHLIGEKKHITHILLISIIMLASLGFGIASHIQNVARASSAILQVSPTSSTYPRQIKVLGSNYGASEKVQIYWNYSGPGTGILERTATSSSAGAFTVLFYIPLTSTGTYNIAGVGMTSGLIATVSFQLLPSISVTPVAGIAGTTATLTGNAFGVGENVNIYWSYSTKSGTGTLLATVPANSTGSFSYTFNVPSGSPVGRITVAGTGQSSNMTALSSFTIYPPTLALAPVQGSAGTSLSLSAYGFFANEQVNFYWNGGKKALGFATTNGVGYFAPTTITVPAGSTPGSYTVTATGQTSNISATSKFTVIAPNSTLSSISGPVGENVNMSGQGYAPGEMVNILWNYSGPGTGTSVAQITAGVAGAFVGSLIVPAVATGLYPVAAVGMTSNFVSQNTFSVGNGLVASPTSTPPGTNVTISGMGFHKNESVTINLDSSSGPLLATATADNNGNISQSITIPGSTSPGSHNLVGLGLTSHFSYTGTVTVNTNWGAFGFDYPHTRNNSFENSITSANVSSLTLKWTANLGNGFWSSPVYANGIVYQASSRGILNAYNATTGALVWQYNTNTVDTAVSAPLVDPTTNTVFYGTITQLISSATDVGLPSPVYALNAQTGTLEWEAIIPDDEYGFPTLAFNTIYVGSATEDHPGDVLAFDILSGNLKWDYHTHSTWGSVAVDTSTGTVFTGNANPNAQVLALNAQTGQLVWQFNVPNSSGDTDVGSGIAIANGLVYANSKNGNVYALYESNGTMAWSNTIALHYDFSDVSSPALSPNNVLYVGSTDQNLYAINATSGAVLWKAFTNNGISSSPALANGVVYFASQDNSIYAVDANTGNILWSFATGALSYSSPIVVNGWLYCGSDDGKLYAFSL
ncbi:MAG TPA: PQQ-binding-like beta-propeller repeat protein [Ktedonobacteraceae bacterium]|nr:PQQ-binding-like beta-propeller repeat protein [Ktedonobacteraceae bacterium]